MGGFLMTGLIVLLVASIANIFLGIPALSLAVSAGIVLVMSGLILFDTSRIIHGGETNYIRATVSLYLSVYNLFIHLLHLLGVAGDLAVVMSVRERSSTVDRLWPWHPSTCRDPLS